MNRAIGIFDSGVGGLTVFSAIKRKLPHESLIYFGDTARVPYGTKSEDTIIKYSLACANFMLHRGIKILVVACNTSSAYSLPVLRKEMGIPVIGVIEPGAHAALAVTKTKHIGVIGTLATINSNAYAKLLKKLDPLSCVVSQACPLFVPLVEEGWLDNKVARLTAEHYLESFNKEKIDTLILGCTHYPLLKPLIQDIVGKNVNLVDSAEATASAVKDALFQTKLLADQNAKPSAQFYVTDLPTRFESALANFLGRPLPSVKRIEL